nr:hypothetical protein [uncultured organism]
MPAESTPVITSATPAASEPVAPAGGEAGTGSVDASANEAAPSFDMAEARSTARLIAKHRKDGLVAFPKPEPPLQRDDRLGRAIERARRADCKTAYAGLSLLAIIPLVKDTVTGTGCKW